MIEPRGTSGNHVRRPVSYSAVALLAVAGLGTSCITVVLGKPVPCEAPTEAADQQLQKLYEEGAIVSGDPLDLELGGTERYCDYIDSLRGDL